jgi:hypothetical protein
MDQTRVKLTIGLLVVVLGSLGLLSIMLGNLRQTNTAPNPMPTAPSSSITRTVVVALTRWPTPYSTPQLNPTEIAAFRDIYNGTNTGTVIARGTNTTPVATSSPFISYEVREYILPVPVTMERGLPNAAGNDFELGLVTFQKMWILSVTGGPFYPGGNMYSIWLDDRLLGGAAGSLDQISVFIYDPQLLQEGAAIGVSWGSYPPGEDYYLPERLHLIRPPAP